MTDTLARPTVLTWEDDPGVPPTLRNPISRPSPDLSRTPLPVGVAGPPPPTGSDEVGSAEFRYWAAADAMRRAADFWAAIVPAGTTWNPLVGSALVARLDQGDDMNAYYDRTGLSFFHHGVGAVTVYSGESPDVVCHELGHAVLDAVRPELWDAASSEIASFHESFADISALLTVLQVQTFRTRVLSETRGVLSRSSSLSRLAEQLGWAIRSVAPQAVDPDCLRNAANRFLYRNPLDLPPRAPATQLSSEVHSFSRVFTGAYLRVLAGVFRNGTHDEAGLLQAAEDAGRLLITAVSQAPVTTGYFAQVAAHVVAADTALFGGRNSAVIRAAFIRQAILSPQASASLTSGVLQAHVSAMAALPSTRPLGVVGAAGAGGDRALANVEIDGHAYGVDGVFTASAPGQSRRFDVAGAAPAGGSMAPGSGPQAAQGFVDDLFRTGRVEVSMGAGRTAPRSSRHVATHTIATDVDGAAGRRLVRRLFD